MASGDDFARPGPHASASCYAGSMWLKARMLLLWGVAIGAIVIVTTQSAAPTWLAASWVLACVCFAIWGTTTYGLGRRRQRRWDAGDYNQR